MGKIIKVSGPLVVADGMADANMADVVRVGPQQLIGEILNMTGDRASIQVYEETSGLGPGADVVTTGAPLSVELGPGLIENIYDGIQRPLEEIMKVSGNNLQRGVEIPALELKLPVMSEWDYNRLKIAPCRQFGSSRTDDLVIAAHNYQNHFGRLKDLQTGNAVIFTDMEGVINTYSIEKIETLNPSEVDAVQNSGYDLVLYTCTKGGRTRVTVFCNRIKIISPSPAPTQMEK